MTNWLILKNNSKVNKKDIPILDFDILRKEILSESKRPIAFLAQKNKSV